MFAGLLLILSFVVAFLLLLSNKYAWEVLSYWEWDSVAMEGDSDLECVSEMDPSLQ